MAHTVSEVYSYLILLLNINFNGMFNFGYTQIISLRNFTAKRKNHIMIGQQ